MKDLQNRTFIVYFFLQRDKSQWKLFFYTVIGMLGLSNLTFVVFGSGELQSWDAYGLDKTKQDNIDERRRKMSKKLSVAMANF